MIDAGPWSRWGLDGPLGTEKEALSAIDRWGLAHVIGRKGGLIPSLWRSALRPGWETIGPWVNGFAERRLVYSAAVARGQPTLVSLWLLPSLLAVVCPRSLEHEYQQGRLDRDLFMTATALYDALEDGELDTIELGRRSGLGTKAMKPALGILQGYGLIGRAGVRVPNWVVNIWARTEDLFPVQFRTGAEMACDDGAIMVLDALSAACGERRFDALITALGWRMIAGPMIERGLRQRFAGRDRS